MDYDLIIIGGGPAGLTAGIYASRARLKALLLEKQITGGLAATTAKLENYPGFPDGVAGMELLTNMRGQAERFGAQISEFEEVTGVKRKDKLIEVTTDKNTYSALALIVSTGSEPKKLNIPGEDIFYGKGVSYCATCDGPLFSDLDVAVIGCGNSGLQEGEHLLKFARTVKFIEYLPYMTAEKILQERLQSYKNTTFFLNHIPIKIEGDDKVNSIVIRERNKSREEVIPVRGVFIYIGLNPNSGFLKGFLEMDKLGFVLTNQDMETSVPGIFAAGDIRSKEIRQVSTAVGEGTTAAINAEKYIEKRHRDPE